MKKLYTFKVIITELAEKGKHYQENLLEAVDRTKAKIDSKRSRKNHIKGLCRSIPHEKSSYSLENLIREELDDLQKITKFKDRYFLAI